MTNCTNDVAYSFVKWKLFSGIEVSSTDFHISVLNICGNL